MYSAACIPTQKHFKKKYIHQQIWNKPKNEYPTIARLKVQGQYSSGKMQKAKRSKCQVQERVCVSPTKPKKKN
jgi:hypothetical protein